MKRFGLVLALGLLVAACDDLQDVVLTGPRPGGPRATFVCDDKSRLVVRFPREQAVLTTPRGATVVLRQGPAADGFFYEGHGHQIRGHGRALDWTPPDGQPRACQRE